MATTRLESEPLAGIRIKTVSRFETNSFRSRILRSKTGRGRGVPPPATPGSEFAPQIAAHPPLLYAITYRSRFPDSEDEPQRQAALLRTAARWAAIAAPDGPDAPGRPDFVQLREKDLEAGALAALARNLLHTLNTGQPAPKLLINSRADVAIAVAAAGVHLTSAPGELTPSQVRRLYAAAGLPGPIISVSCHTLAEVARAASPEAGAAATLILFGPVFEKVVSDIPGEHTAAGSGLELLRSACAAATPTPVLALGGITQTNTPACLAAGAAGIAAIRLFARV